MKKFKTWMFESNNEKVILKRATFWNLISSLLNASMTAVIIFFMTRAGQTEIAGFFSIATAVAYQVQAIGFFGVRNYHIADVTNRYSFSDFVYINLFSSVLMIVSLIFIIFKNGYSGEKALIVLFYSLFRAIDVYEALFHDEYQRQRRIDIGLILQTIRYLVSLTVLIVLLLITGSLVIGIIGALIISILLVYIQNKDFCESFRCHIRKLQIAKFKNLLWVCLPICIAGFISIYLTNAPKYAIDSVMNDQVQGIFAILFVPVFTINLLATVIYRPYITQISVEWTYGRKRQFIKMILKQVFVIILLSLTIIVFGYIIGLKLLGMVYSIDLMPYMSEFLILLIGGGLNTLAIFINQIMVIIGCYHWNLIIYLVAILITVLYGDTIVMNHQLMGASILYSLPSIVLIVFSLIVLIIKICRLRSNLRN